MRENLYRAWDPVNKKMYYWDTVKHPAIEEITGTPYPKLFYLPMSWLCGDSNDWIWQQFTGLLDKNGVKIYEGDIIKLKGHDVIYPKKVDIEEVFFSEDDGCYYHTYRDRPSKRFWKHAKVIGNIYENTKLIK